MGVNMAATSESNVTQRGQGNAGKSVAKSVAQRPQPAAREIHILWTSKMGLTLAGFGIGLGWPHLLTRVLQQAPEDDREKAGKTRRRATS